MPLNRELLASLSFEPSDVSGDDSATDSEKEPVGKLEDADDYGPGQNEATKLVIHCLKLALAESIISISHPEKQRPLNPKSDFTIEATTEFTKKEENSKSRGISCCGPASGQTKSRRRDDGVSNGRRPRQRYTGPSFGVRRATEVDDVSASFGVGAAASSSFYGHRNGAHPGEQLPRNRGGMGLDTMSARQRHRRSFAARSEAASATEDDDSEGEDGEGPKVDFQFTDYSPMCYRHIREFFGVDPKEYCDVLRDSRWHSIPTPGKSAAQLFFCGRDWVIKTMTTNESEFLRDILHRYYYHVRDNPYTLLPHFVGHYHLKIGTETHNFIIMQNVFATTNTIHEKFDLKGSTIGRFASDGEKLRATCTQKDLDIHRPLHIGPERRELLIEQLKADCDFLKRSHIMDYSFLVGIHILPQKRPVVVSSNHSGSVNPAAAAGSTVHSPGSPFAQTLDAGAMTSRTLTANALHAGGGGGAGINLLQTPLPVAPLQATTSSAPPQQQQQRQYQQQCSYPDGRCFVADQGGMESNDVAGLRKEIYYIGIIDILQEYNTRKRFETAILGAVYGFHRISSVDPGEYAARFIAFMTSIIV